MHKYWREDTQTERKVKHDLHEQEEVAGQVLLRHTQRKDVNREWETHKPELQKKVHEEKVSCKSKKKQVGRHLSERNQKTSTDIGENTSL